MILKKITKEISIRTRFDILCGAQSSPNGGDAINISTLNLDSVVKQKRVWLRDVTTELNSAQKILDSYTHAPFSKGSINHTNANKQLNLLNCLFKYFKALKDKSYMPVFLLLCKNECLQDSEISGKLLLQLVSCNYTRLEKYLNEDLKKARDTFGDINTFLSEIVQGDDEIHQFLKTTLLFQVYHNSQKLSDLDKKLDADAEFIKNIAELAKQLYVKRSFPDGVESIDYIFSQFIKAVLNVPNLDEKTRIKFITALYTAHSRSVLVNTDEKNEDEKYLYPDYVKTSALRKKILGETFSDQEKTLVAAFNLSESGILSCATDAAVANPKKVAHILLDNCNLANPDHQKKYQERIFDFIRPGLYRSSSWVVSPKKSQSNFFPPLKSQSESQLINSFACALLSAKETQDTENALLQMYYAYEEFHSSSSEDLEEMSPAGQQKPSNPAIEFYQGLMRQHPAKKILLLRAASRDLQLLSALVTEPELKSLQQTIKAVTEQAIRAAEERFAKPTLLENEDDILERRTDKEYKDRDPQFLAKIANTLLTLHDKSGGDITQDFKIKLYKSSRLPFVKRTIRAKLHIVALLNSVKLNDNMHNSKIIQLIYGILFAHYQAHKNKSEPENEQTFNATTESIRAWVRAQYKTEQANPYQVFLQACKFSLSQSKAQPAIEYSDDVPRMKFI